MANSYHKGRTHSADPQPAPEIWKSIDAFLSACRSPAVLEYGEEVMPLRPGEFALEIRSDRLWIDVWHDNRSLSRRIVSIENRSPGTLDCAIHRFGGATGKLSFLDLDRPQTAHRRLTGTRLSFGEQFRRMLSRQFPGWEVTSLSASMDLQRSFSPLFPRARLVRGQRQIAAIACPEPLHEPDCLTFALLWFAHVSAQAGRKVSSTALHLFLPEGAGSLTAHRLRWLSRIELGVKLFLFNSHGSAGEVDPDDLGNLDTKVKSRYCPPQLSPELQSLLESLALRPDVGFCPDLEGAISVRFRGREFARLHQNRLLLGMESKEEIPIANAERALQFADQLLAIGREFTPAPECWLESAVRSQLSALDPALRPVPVHAQVLSMAGRDRDALDLLALSHAGRLAVIELKASEDIQLPVQALDYWIRVNWHARRRELDHLFPDSDIRLDPPRLLLVAPALSFHPTNETVLRYFSPEIDVERIGINSDWQTRLKVVLRLQRGEQPQSHQKLHEHQRPATHQESDQQSES